MRKALFPAAVVAAVWIATLAAQQPDPAGDESTDPAGEASREPTTTQRRTERQIGRPPPGIEMGSKLEWFLMRPGRVMIRDTWRVGRIDCRPWDNTAPGGEGALRVNVIVASLSDRPEERTAGLELVLQDEFMDHTFFFDPEQLGDLQVALETVRATAETMRDPPADVGRRAVYHLNGLELGMAPRRAGGYLAPVGPDEQSIGLNPDNFREMKRLLTEAQTILKREAVAR